MISRPGPAHSPAVLRAGGEDDSQRMTPVRDAAGRAEIGTARRTQGKRELRERAVHAWSVDVSDTHNLRSHF